MQVPFLTKPHPEATIRPCSCANSTCPPLHGCPPRCLQLQSHQIAQAKESEDQWALSRNIFSGAPRFHYTQWVFGRHQVTLRKTLIMYHVQWVSGTHGYIFHCLWKDYRWQPNWNAIFSSHNIKSFIHVRGFFALSAIPLCELSTTSNNLTHRRFQL